MARTQTMIQLTDELVQLLDAEAIRQGLSRSALVRRAVEELLASSADRETSRRIVEGYRRLPPATPDQWGQLADVGDTAVGELLSRLDEEEAGAGW